ncbi:hypothetical protein DD559_18655 [Sphingomonas pokkalii]|uniref:Uncharacterized protein n=1 Tax=Sphingomonas pokkalii TaxID=2175090 RepID=A0A2U0SID3_9SPHN|nr:hypothetical protein DD559_18655 [Sphingomonas pokkalii]
MARNRFGPLDLSATLVVAGLNAEPSATLCGSPAGSSAQKRMAQTMLHAATTAPSDRRSVGKGALPRMVEKERAMQAGS